MMKERAGLSQETNLLRASRNLLSLALCATTTIALFGGCMKPRVKDNTQGNSSSQNVDIANSSNASISKQAQEITKEALSKFPNPGPYKIVEKTEKDKSGKEITKEYILSKGKVGRYGGVLKYATFGSSPKTYNYWSASDHESRKLSLLIFDRMIDSDPWTGEAYPRMAKSIEVSPDKKAYTITLRKGLLWSDDKPITADDVVFTFETIIGKGFGNSSTRDVMSVNGKYPKIEKVDDLTVRFTTDAPFYPFLNSIAQIPIAPKHKFEKVVKGNANDFMAFWDTNCQPETVVCSGPFMPARNLAGQRLELKRNPNYSIIDEKGQKLPYLDGVIQYVVPNLGTQILKFSAGELDLLDIRSIRGNDAASMKSKQNAQDFTMYNLGPDDGTTFLVFNLCTRVNPKTKKPYVDPVKQEWFNNKLFRQAISHALNRQQVVSNVLKGVGLPLYTAFTTANNFYNPKLEAYPQDLALSAKLLEEAGFKKKGNILYDKKGNRVEFTLLTNSDNSVRDAVCTMIKDDMAKLGIKVNYQGIDFNLLVDRTNTSLDWEAIVMGLTGDKVEPYSHANVWKSDGRLHIFNQRIPDDKGNTIVTDATDYEKEIDKLFDEGAITFDLAKRHEIFDRMQAIVYDQQPFIYIYTPLDITAMRNTMDNYRPLPTQSSMETLYNVEEFFVKEKR